MESENAVKNSDLQGQKENSLESLVPPLPKTPITCVERTRKLSILLKHQPCMVSQNYINIFANNYYSYISRYSIHVSFLV